MPAAIARTPDKWAILIGIDRYVCADAPVRRDTDDNPIELKDLQGCVNDVLAVEEYLIKVIHIKPENVRKLLAPLPARKLESLGEFLEPTHNNILDALKIPIQAEAGDLVYFHYSGHGLRATTCFKELDNTRLFDEVLVPSDFAQNGCYLPDLELGMLLQTMENAGLIVTAVLDCCHSGGAVRSSNKSQLGETRSLPSIYKSDPELNRPRSFAQIQVFSHHLCLPKSKNAGYFVLAACQDEEEAKEIEVGGRSHGLLTHSLLSTLQKNHEDVVSRSIYDDVFFEVQNHNRMQRPVFVGSENRFFFSNETRQRGHAIHLRVQKSSLDPRKDMRDQILHLGGGEIHGIKSGSEFAILPRAFGSTQSFGKEDVLARAEVIHVHTTECTAMITEIFDTQEDKIKEGCLAILVRQPITTRFIVKLGESFTPQGRKNFEQQWHKVQNVGAWLVLCSDDDNDDNDTDKQVTQFLVNIAENDHFEIQDRSASFTSLHQQATQKISKEYKNRKNMHALIRRLEHLARFVMTKELSNTNIQLFGTPKLVSVELTAASKAFPGMEGRGVSLGTLDEVVPGLHKSDEKTLLCATIRNQTSHRLGVVILNCGAELSVHRMWPREEPFRRLDPHAEETAFLVLEIEDNLRPGAENGAEIIDTLKIFVCKPERGLDALSLPDLWTREKESGHARGTAPKYDHLSNLLKDLDKSRKGFSMDPVDINWETTDIRVQSSIRAK